MSVNKSNSTITVNLCSTDYLDYLISMTFASTTNSTASSLSNNSTGNSTSNSTESFGRFFFLKYPSTLACLENFYLNPLIITLIVLLISYIILVIILYCKFRDQRKNQVLIEFLRKEIMKESYPYYTEKDIDKRFKFDKIIHVPKMKKKNNVFAETKGMNSMSVRGNIIVSAVDLDKAEAEAEAEYETKKILEHKKLEVLKLKERQFDSERLKANEDNIFGHDFYEILEGVIDEGGLQRKIMQKEEEVLKMQRDLEVRSKYINLFQ